MKENYLSNYIKLYFWQVIAIVLNFTSMFIVLPYLSSDKAIFGVYSLCLSFNIFLSYADLGFIGAGFKYASEAFAKKDKEEEIEIIGFTTFVLIIAIVLFMGTMFMASCNPSLFISNLNSKEELFIASRMFFILGSFSVTTVIQRILQFIYGVRVEDYIIRKINIVGHIGKIISVFYFFREGSYNILGYYLLFQSINLLCAMSGFFVARRIYSFSFRNLARNVKFSYRVYCKVKGLALTSFLMSALWIVYYELDSPVIAKYYGANKLAYYAIGLSLLSFMRSIFGILYSPFAARFNHFLGVRDEDGLKEFYYNTIVYLLPLSVFSVLTITILMKNIIFTWVGPGYDESIFTAQLLILTFLFAFNNYPASLILLGKEKNKELRFVNFFIALVFWSLILILNNYYSYQSFAISKLVVFTISTAFYIYFTRDYIFSSKNFSKDILLPMTFGSLVTTITAVGMSYILPIEQGKLNLFYVVCACSFSCILGFSVYFLTNTKFRNDVLSIIRKSGYFKTSR